MTTSPPQTKPRESDEKPVESELFPMGLGYSFLLGALGLVIARKVKALIHKHCQSPSFHVFLCEF